MFVVPAMRPLAIAMKVASLSATLRVKLLSSPHAKQAPTTANAGSAAPKRASPGQLSTMAPATIKAMPSAMRRSEVSLDTNHASGAVEGPSALRMHEGPHDGILAK